MYTSGTTGTPKGALLSHANLIHAGRAVCEAHALTAADRVLSSLPLYHVNGQCIATIAPLLAGGSIVMPHRFSASQWWGWVERYQPTWLNVVPTIIAYLLNGADPTPAQAAACRQIRFARSASAPLAARAASRVRVAVRHFGAGGDGTDRVRVGGVRESARSAPAQDRLAGMPLGVEARIVAPDGAVLGEGESGEIEVRGANVMLRYHDDAGRDGAHAPRRRLACHRRSRLSRSRRLLLHHRPLEGADHQGRREHRAARDRRGAAAAPGGARGRGGRHPGPRIRPGHPRLRRAEGGYDVLRR